MVKGDSEKRRKKLHRETEEARLFPIRNGKRGEFRATHCKKSHTKETRPFKSTFMYARRY